MRWSVADSATHGGHTMKKLLLAAIALAIFSLSPPPAGAQSSGTTVPFMTVDAVNVGEQGSLRVTGIVQGDSTPSTRTISYTSGLTDAQKAAMLETCHRSLLLALSKPGQYVVQAGAGLCNVALVAP